MGGISRDPTSPRGSGSHLNIRIQVFAHPGYKRGVQDRETSDMAEIVIMEDDAHFAGLVGQSLTEAGHSVAIAPTGEAALEIVMTRRIDLVIVDILIRVNGVLLSDGGLLLLTRLRQQSPSRPFRTPRDIPAIAMSGAVNTRWTKDLLKTAHSFGATETLGKPFPPSHMLALVARLTGNCGPV